MSENRNYFYRVVECPRSYQDQCLSYTCKNNNPRCVYYESCEKVDSTNNSSQQHKKNTNLPFGLTKKLLHHLVYIPFIQGIVRIRMYGNEKHNGPNTWWKLTKDELYNKMRRHLDEWYMGEIDPETHDSHMLHLSCNAMFAYLKNFEGLEYLKKLLEKFKI